MEKKMINVPGAEEFAQPQTRSDFFKALASAGIGATVASAVLFPREAQAQQGGDVDIFNFALTLELLEVDFYTRALGSGMLFGEGLAVVSNALANESAHRDFLLGAIPAQGGAVAPLADQFVFPEEVFSSQDSILQQALEFENTGVGALLGAGPLISDPSNLEAALSLYGTENDHVTALRNALGFVPPANEAFKTPLTQEEVLARVTPFLASPPSGPAASEPPSSVTTTTTTTTSTGGSAGSSSGTSAGSPSGSSAGA